MKTHSRFIFVTIAAALYATVSAIAGDSQWQVIDNHHGTLFHLRRPDQAGATIAFGGHAKPATSVTPKPDSNPAKAKSEFREITTPHGTVNYFVPAE